MRFTTVIGVDGKHLEQLSHSWSTWIHFKDEILDNPLVVFYDHTQVTKEQVAGVVLKHDDATIIPWPYLSFDPQPNYGSGYGDRWSDPQRYKMLAGFVHVPADSVSTEYWLKLDTDTIAKNDDPILDEEWFSDKPSIVCQPWGYTKPVNQMDRLDRWAEEHELFNTPPLNLKKSTSLVRHKRIISWCGFFSTDLTTACSHLAVRTCGEGRLPVPSQDGYVWYVATRLGTKIKRVRMSDLGWRHLSTTKGVVSEAYKVLYEKESS